jgi:hypothetical protein
MNSEQQSPSISEVTITYHSLIEVSAVSPRNNSPEGTYRVQHHCQGSKDQKHGATEAGGSGRQPRQKVYTRIECPTARLRAWKNPLITNRR